MIAPARRAARRRRRARRGRSPACDARRRRRLRGGWVGADARARPPLAARLASAAALPAPAVQRRAGVLDRRRRRRRPRRGARAAPRRHRRRAPARARGHAPAATAAATASPASPARSARTTCRCRATQRTRWSSCSTSSACAASSTAARCYDERHLCHSPQERLFIDGDWHDGLLPPSTTADAALRCAVPPLRARRSRRCGRELPFAIPTARAAGAPAHAALDALDLRAVARRARPDAPAAALVPRLLLPRRLRRRRGAGVGLGRAALLREPPRLSGAAATSATSATRC